MEKPKIITVRLPRKQHNGEVIDRYISYKGSKYSLTEEKFSDLLQRLPDVWNTEKDKLISFSLYDDKTYSCFRKKDTYNFSIKETEEKSYFFDGATQSQVDELVGILASFYNECLITDQEDIYQTIIDNIQNTSYIKQRILALRQEVLENSDYMFNRDYKFKTEEEEQEWIDYRQEWRDITEQDFWVNNNFSNFSLPVSPKPAAQDLTSVIDNLSEFLYSKKIPNKYITEIKEYMTSVDYINLMKNFSALMFKSHVLQILTELKLPIGGSTASLIAVEDLFPKNMSELISDFDAAEDTESSFEEGSTPWEIHIKKIDEKLKVINDQLSEYNINITVSDIINKIVDSINETEKNYELEREAINLLEDVAIGESIDE